MGLVGTLISTLALVLVGGFAPIQFDEKARFEPNQGISTSEILRFFLWCSNVIPWHYIQFLNEAVDRILLERVNGGYRFIHPLFQDYFSSLDSTVSASAPASTPQQ